MPDTSKPGKGKKTAVPLTDATALRQEEKEQERVVKEMAKPLRKEGERK